MQILTLQSLQNFAHNTTAVLSWLVQQFVVITWPRMDLQQNEISLKSELRWKSRKWNRPQIGEENEVQMRHISTNQIKRFN